MPCRSRYGTVHSYRAYGKKILLFIILFTIALSCYLSLEYKMPSFIPRSIIHRLDSRVKVVSRTDLDHTPNSGASTTSTIQNGRLKSTSQNGRPKSTSQNGRPKSTSQNGRPRSTSQNGRFGTIDDSFIRAKHPQNILPSKLRRNKPRRISTGMTNTAVSRLMDDISSVVDGDDNRVNVKDWFTSSVWNDQISDNYLSVEENETSSSSYDHIDTTKNAATTDANDYHDTTNVVTTRDRDGFHNTINVATTSDINVATTDYANANHSTTNEVTTSISNGIHGNIKVASISDIDVATTSDNNDVHHTINVATTSDSDVAMSSGNSSLFETNDKVYARIIPADSDRVTVIILTQKRSGSSFLGEIFNQNENFTYFFEPLCSVTQNIMLHRMKGTLFGQISHEIFHGILHRDFSHMPTGWWSGHVPRVTCASKTIAPFSRLCGTHDNTVRPLSLNEKMKLLGVATTQRRGLAIKTIRIQDLNSLKDFVIDPSLNVKIIHLVRDPRGVMNSRQHMKEANLDLIVRKGRQADEIADLCQHMDRTLKARAASSWLDERYKLVRYEDAANDPLAVASDIYDFVGIDFPQSVKDWILRNTMYDSGDTFSRTRNSKQTASAWRSQMDNRRVLEIQQKCAAAMAEVGYLPLTSYFDLRNVKVNLMGKPKLSHGPTKVQDGLL